MAATDPRARGSRPVAPLTRVPDRCRGHDVIAAPMVGRVALEDGSHLSGLFARPRRWSLAQVSAAWNARLLQQERQP